MSTSLLEYDLNTALHNAHMEGKRAFFDSGATRSYQFRKKQLKKLKSAIEAQEEEICRALAMDLGKPDFEAYTSEVVFMYMEINHTLKNLKKWMRTKKVSTPLPLLPASSRIIKEPYGLTLIIGAWNYPFQLLLGPLVGAIAAGNTAVLKPSELTPHTARIIESLIDDTFDQDYISVVQGEGAEVVPALMDKHRFDYIFFTGSVPVGKAIAQQAAKKLTPVTLELGGKSPAIVDRTANLKVAARRIAWGKFFNAGQTCVSPDYLLIEDKVKGPFIESMKEVLEEFYAEGTRHSRDYTRILNEKRFDTLIGYLEQGRIILGGGHDRDNLYIAPTLMDEIRLDTPIMQEEIFGPILPMISFRNYDEVIQVIRKNPHPLSLYHFTGDKRKEKIIIEGVQFGGGAVNDTILHLSNPQLPFGGIGNSGIGSYHGQYSFDTFSHQKSVMKNITWYDNKLRYPPYKPSMKKLAKLFLS
jgi:aldehyde dehydrogenase (NAD+)